MQIKQFEISIQAIGQPLSLGMCGAGSCCHKNHASFRITPRLNQKRQANKNKAAIKWVILTYFHVLWFEKHIGGRSLQRIPKPVGFVHVDNFCDKFMLVNEEMTASFLENILSTQIPEIPHVTT